jgi:uncharacterized protein YdhG (YjbR/CyaY superfamily)
MSARPAVTNIDDYISGFQPATRAVLEEVRALVRKTAPDAVETMSYGIPTFDLKKKHLVHFAGFERHVGFYPTPSGIEAFKDEIQGYTWAKGSVQFPLDAPMPLDLIRRMVEFRVEEVTKKARK